MAGTKGTFCIEGCVEKLTYWEGAVPGQDVPAPQVFDYHNNDFNSTFPMRLHAYLEDVTNKVPKEMCIRDSSMGASPTSTARTGR